MYIHTIDINMFYVHMYLTICTAWCVLLMLKDMEIIRMGKFQPLNYNKSVEYVQKINYSNK